MDGVFHKKAYELFSESILPFGKEVGNLRYELMSECYFNAI